MSAKLPPALCKMLLLGFGLIYFFLKNQNNPKKIKEELKGSKQRI